MEWAFLHQEELRVNWQLAREHAPLEKVEPLEWDHVEGYCCGYPAGEASLAHPI
jgi:hypothetical protein